MKSNLILILALPFLAVSCNWSPVGPDVSTLNLEVGSAIVQVEISDTDEARRIGLSNRDYLAEDGGMLFVFPETARHGFWMKDTLIPLDFVWIAEGQVVDITANVPVELGQSDAELTQYLPSKPVDSMLEVNAGWIDRNEVKIGDLVRFIDRPARP